MEGALTEKLRRISGDPRLTVRAATPLAGGACSEVTDNVLGAEFKVRHINSNDGTVEGLDLLDKPAFTIQFHPEACPGPHDASPLFDRFQKMVAEHLGKPEAEIVSKDGGS